MKIGDQLRHIRKERGLTLKEVSNNTGIDIGYLSKIERNLINVSFEKIKILADNYNISLDSLVQEDNNWQERVPTDMAYFVQADNLPYLKVGIEAKKSGFTPEDAQKMIKIYKNMAAIIDQ